MTPTQVTPPQPSSTSDPTDPPPDCPPAAPSPLCLPARSPLGALPDAPAPVLERLPCGPGPVTVPDPVAAPLRSSPQRGVGVQLG